MDGGRHRDVRALDVDDDSSLSDPDATLKVGFNTAKEGAAVAAIAGGPTDGAAAAVSDAYHSTVPPFCLASVQALSTGSAAPDLGPTTSVQAPMTRVIVAA